MGFGAGAIKKVNYDASEPSNCCVLFCSKGGWKVPMPNSGDYRSFAQSQRRAAHLCPVGEEAEQYLRVARRWEAIADDAEQFERVHGAIRRR